MQAELRTISQGVCPVHTVIIGNGIAGNAVAFHLRRLDPRSKVTIVSTENCQAYDPGALPYYVSGDVPREAVFLKMAEDNQKEDMEFVLGAMVAAIQPDRKTISLENGEELGYDNLVIATGGNPVIPPFPGNDKEGILGCKSLAEAEQLASHQGHTAVVIGSGLIGIEASEALKKNGYRVYLVELLGWIMPRVFDKEPADQLAASLDSNGIDVLTDERVLSIEGNKGVQGVTTDKRTISCDTVVLAAGVRPATKLAADAGLSIGKTGGIKVNDMMMSSSPDVYACGDCVETKDAFTGDDAMYQLRHNAVEQGEVIARKCCGVETAYRGAWSFTRVHYFGTYAIALGKSYSAFQDKSGLEIIDRASRDGFSRLVVKNGQLMGAQLIGKPARAAGLLLGAMWRHENLDTLRDNWESVVMFDSPLPWQNRVLGKYMNC